MDSCLGLPHNERADRLARVASDDLTMHPDVKYTYIYIKSRLRSLVSKSVTTQLELRCPEGIVPPAFTVPRYQVSALTLMAALLLPMIWW